MNSYIDVKGFILGMLEVATYFALRGSVSECEYYLKGAAIAATTVRSTVLASRVAMQTAHLQCRQRKFDDSHEKLLEVSEALEVCGGRMKY